MLITLVLSCSDYELSGDPVRARPRDGEGDNPANDTAGSADDDDDATGTGEASEQDDAEPCEGARHVRIGLAADDYWEGFIDGVAFGAAEHWWEAAWYEMELECGEHAIAVYAADLHQAISGFIAIVEVEGEPVTRTGDGAWRVAAGSGGSGWQEPGFDDSSWDVGTSCEATSAMGWWGDSPPDLRAAGAWWIWSGECLNLGDARFRITVNVE